MKTIKAKLKILTPMFSYGVNQNSVEFRMTELKALMRTTFRELYKFENLEDMKTKEAELFGSLKKKSPIIFKSAKVDENDIGKDFLCPHKDNKETDLKHCFKKDASIKIELLVKDINNVDTYVYILIFSSILGGLGKRCRKGFGSFTVEDIKVVDDDEKTSKYSKLLKKSVSEIFKKIYKDIQVEDKKCMTRLKIKDDINYTSQLEKGDNYPFIEELSMLNLKCDFKKALKIISQETHNRTSRDYLSKDKRYDQYILGDGKSRFASMVYITFWEDKESKKYIIIKKLNYKYKYITKDRKDKKDNKDNKDYIKKFIDEITKKVVVKN